MCKLILFMCSVCSILVLSGCKNGDGCGSTITITFSGRVVDSNGNPLQDVNVMISTHGATPVDYTTTDANGQYLKTWPRAAPLYNTYLVFTKSGFTDFTSQAETLGGNCSHDSMSIDATLSP